MNRCQKIFLVTMISIVILSIYIICSLCRCTYLDIKFCDDSAKTYAVTKYWWTETSVGFKTIEGQIIILNDYSTIEITRGWKK